MPEKPTQPLRCFTRLVLTLLFTVPVTGAAHEYWLDPVRFHMNVGDKISVNIRNGQNFKGTALIYNPANFDRHYLLDSSGKTRFNNRIGDYPALQAISGQSGLTLVLVDTQEKSLVYPTLEKFHAFLDYHALPNIKARHRKRGMPQQDIVEHYYRYNKSFVTAGQSDPATDPPVLAPQQQALEIVALENPYTAGDTLDIQILYNSLPLAGRQVETFRQSLDVNRTVTTSDSKGIATINISDAGKYLINVVHVIDAVDQQADWISHWASMTFLIKDNN